MDKLKEDSVDLPSTLRKLAALTLAFARTHALRIVSGLLILGGCLFLAIAHPYPFLAWLLLLCPPMVGLGITALSIPEVSDLVNGQNDRLDDGVQAARARGTKPARFFVRPVLWCGALIWRLGGRLRNAHFSAAVKVTGAAYLLAVVGFVVAVVAVVFFWLAVIVIGLMVALWVFGSSSDEKQKRQQSREPASESEVLPQHAVQGRFHSGSGWWNQELAGRVDEDGIIYKGTSWINEERIGRIDEDGTIYRGTSFWNEEEAGRIDGDGTIYKGSNWFNRERAGRVTEDGEVMKGSGWWDEERAGKIDKE